MNNRTRGVYYQRNRCKALQSKTISSSNRRTESVRPQRDDTENYTLIHLILDLAQIGSIILSVATHFNVIAEENDSARHWLGASSAETPESESKWAGQEIKKVVRIWEVSGVEHVLWGRTHHSQLREQYYVMTGCDEEYHVAAYVMSSVKPPPPTCFRFLPCLLLYPPPNPKLPFKNIPGNAFTGGSIYPSRAIIRKRRRTKF